VTAESEGGLFPGVAPHICPEQVRV